MQIPLVDLKAQYASIQAEIDAAVAAVISDTAFVGGRYVAAFEQAFAGFCEAPHAVGCGNGTDALELALEALGVGPGHEVILPSHTFFASAEAVLRVGATPVFADVEEGGFLIDTEAIPALVSERTRAIMPVHLYGHLCDMDPILEIARDHDLAVVEDSAQAHGARYRGRPAGTMGDVGCFSFYPGKNLGAYGDAGAIVTGDAELAARLSRLRNHGRSGKYEHHEVGVNSRLDGLQASILAAKLVHLHDWNRRRRAAAARYDRLLEGVEGARALTGRPETESVYHLYVVRVPHRDEVLELLRADGIGAGIHYPVPCHLQPAILKTGSRLSLPRTEALAAEILSLPLYPEITPEQIDRVTGSLDRALERTRSR
ncbi:MAG: DegT/DnrJ/EryC1/StrS family aminotransferase [bacterium]|nr:DegT/DnrJ/EryC1/StrS family aminotransferase [bacterium]